MDDTYLVEIRLGRTKWRIKQLISSLTRSFGIGQFMEPHPHVTLFGPLVLNEGIPPEQLLDAIGSVAASYDPVSFLMDGFEKREGLHGGVIAIGVRPSDALKSLSADLAMALLPLCRSLNAWDTGPERKWFHVTIANRLDLGKTSSVYSALTKTVSSAVKPCNGSPSGLARIRDCLFRFFMAPQPEFHPPLLDETGLRITVMHGETILAEYDLSGKRWMYTDHRHDGPGWRDTLAAFRKKTGFEKDVPVTAAPDDIFLIADLHLGHANIIRYCSRPFLSSDVAEMDHVLIGNWNSVVPPGSQVYFVGDLRYSNDGPLFRSYSGQLNGEITFITGNHDEQEEGAILSRMIEYDGERFLLVHDPADAPPSFDGWVIHGHHNNNDLRNYPFISFEKRRINVSAEVVGYVPVSIRDIRAVIRYHQEQGNPKPVLFNYPYVE
jgi:calcineurin-like phosphoesterase family protein